MPVQKYQIYLDKRTNAKKRKRAKEICPEQYELEVRDIIEEIESNLSIMGASGIEDRLQENVPETI